MSADATANAPYHLSTDDLQRFCEFLHQRTGMRFGETKRYYIERRVFERMAATGQPAFAGYFDLLRTSALEVGHVVSSFTVHETYFYREDHQLQCLSQDILPEICRRKGPGDKIRIWSQPCSTGEEAYSIALWLLENWRMVDAYNVEIIGSDIDAVALEAARSGRYAPRALSRLPEPLQDAYFEPSRRGRRQIIADLRESVSFTQSNLTDRTSMTANGRFDVIFCRNVLIYFDDASRRQAVDNLYACLEPGGFICLGHSESMSRISERFAMRRFTDAIVYQRPERN